MRALSKYQDVKDDMLSVIKNQKKSEMCKLSKKRNTILATENKNLLHFDSHKLSSVLKDRAPYLFDILNCIVKKKHFITTAASGPSQRLSTSVHCGSLIRQMWIDKRGEKLTTCCV